MNKYKTLPKEGEMLITITIKLDKNRCNTKHSLSYQFSNDRGTQNYSFMVTAVDAECVLNFARVHVSLLPPMKCVPRLFW